jgi:hypothetical protein
MSRRYKDMWKLGNSPGTMFLVVQRASSKDDDRMSTQLKVDLNICNIVNKGHPGYLEPLSIGSLYSLHNMATAY